ncbi:MAG: methylenetetrahydrofolate--tRNA-(uracil(54)-C(5))-methyltransferase (FADH(2)-oxidizing) TrmFO [Coriobacteriia bacterium]|nr:methylenetetrahydrofolate--tRNA-(uracil(54)-C(5))-methyltransferase (FADH(2)-oxidizing) TrmFO [Coriobacteriia bacterium]
MSKRVAIVGGGLAGSEAALQLADRGFVITLFEMRPQLSSPAHQSDKLAELVCSNSMKSKDPTTAAGLLKRELEILGSQLLDVASEAAIDAGTALAVDRDQFSEEVTRIIEAHPAIEVRREEFIYTYAHGFDALIIAAGPLASDALMNSLGDLVGVGLSFFDAAAPIISGESIDLSKAFFASRYGKGAGKDYLNCPFDQQEYEKFHHALLSGERVINRTFEGKDLFSACQPIEEIARSGKDSLRFGALKPVGIDTPKTGRWAYALAQLRAEDHSHRAFNLVGFQTNLTWPEQRRIFSLIPGLEHAEFLRYGVMHRNTFIDTPRLCNPDFSLKSDPLVWFAGQIAGTEGYVEAIASGLFVARNVEARLCDEEPFILPTTTVSGALFDHATDPATMEYQPMHVNFGIIEPLADKVRNKSVRYATYSHRALEEMGEYVAARR